MLNLILQIILGIFIVLIMGFIAYSVYDNEYYNSIRLYNTNKKETKIFTGIFPFTAGQARIETINKNDPYYLNINPSVNQNGGAEYSYNFWLYFFINKSSETIIKSRNKDAFIVLFYKGVKQLVPYKQYRLSCDSDKGDGIQPYPYFLVKNPLIKLNNNGKQLVVEYNNLNNPDSFNSSAINLICDNVKNNIYGTNVNKLGIKNINTDMYNKTWNMITVVLQESPSNEEKLFTNRTNCKIYFNSTLISDRSTYNNDVLNLNNETGISTAMKNNIGNLYINPIKNIDKSYTNHPTIIAVANEADKPKDLIDKTIETQLDDDGITSDSPIKMADMSYFNYALNDNQILELFNKGFNKEQSDLASRLNGFDNTKIVKGDRISYNLMANTEIEKNMPVEPI